MTGLIKKIIYLLTRPYVILVIGQRADFILDSFKKISRNDFKIKGFPKKALTFAIGKKDILAYSMVKPGKDDLGFVIRSSRFPVIVVADIDGGTLDSEEKQKELTKIIELANRIKKEGVVVVNFDAGIIRRMKSEVKVQIISFGLQEGADILATDVNIDREGANFKISYYGYTVPFWIKNIAKQEDLYPVLAAIGAGIGSKLNLVEISQALK
jgi:hypothetical protein